MDNNNSQKFLPSEIEQKWQKKWEDEGLFTPDVKNAKNPFFNLMMFPYPSAEGLHVGNMYAFTGADVYAKFNRMQGKDVLEPIGLDGFGIHSENYALKIGVHPKEQAQIAEKNFYRQLRSIGNSFDWQRTVETYNPDYYKWTQWLFIQLFKAGLAYRDTALVNWCPKDLTVLSDEQVIDGKCERCGSEVEKRDLEQWFFRITKYADRLLNNIEGLNWSEKVKIAQRNWIGKSEGAEIEFEVDDGSGYVLLHGFTGSIEADFFPWLTTMLKERGKSVWAENLPDTNNPSIEDQVGFVLKNAQLDENTVLFGHSLGSVVALKVLEKVQKPIKKLVLAAGFAEGGFLDHERVFEKNFNWEFDFETIKKNVGEVVLLRAANDSAVPRERAEFIQSKIGGSIVDFIAMGDHVTGEREDEVLENLLTTLRIFTTRPDTLHGATFMVIAPEHQLAIEIANGAFPNTNDQTVKEYIESVKSKSEIERTGEGKQKSGVVTGLMVINPVNDAKIPVLVCDYVLSSYGTGAIMAVPAHDQRDYETAKKFGLEILPVITAKNATNTGLPADEAYTGPGILIGSDEWNGWEVPSDISRVVDWLENKGIGKRKANFHLRDWLISRQRYWGPPIPMVFCSSCADASRSWFTENETSANQKEVSSIKYQVPSKKEEILNTQYVIPNTDMPGWFPVPDAQLPVLLPDVEDWKPLGTGKSPLANHPEFYETTCPNCKGPAMRETDVSDTFLDSAWYFLRYPSLQVQNSKFKIQNFNSNKENNLEIRNSSSELPWDPEITKLWLPVSQYIGGAEHSVLHLLYSRFITMVLKDLGYLDFEEPFSNFFAHGLIIKDGAKMSKSKGNVVVPDEYISKYGADTLRTYLMFIGPYSDGGDFRDSGIEGMYKFLRKVWKLFSLDVKQSTDISSDRLKMMHETIKSVTQDISTFSYNTAIARLMEWYNYLSQELRDKNQVLSMEEKEAFLKLFAPFAPHMTEELWQSRKVTASEARQSIEIASSQTPRNDEFKSIHLSAWPEYDETFLVADTIIIPVQINGKRRGEIEVSSNDIDNQEKVEDIARQQVGKNLEGVIIKKIIYVSGKIINFVV